MPELRVSKESFDRARNLIIQFLRDANYEGALEDGTGISDAVIKPQALLYALFGQAVDRAAAYLSLSQAEEMRQGGRLDEDEYAAAVDAIMSNWFVSRNAGKPTSGVLRLWFLRQVDFLRFAKGESVGSADGVPLVAATDRVFVADDFTPLLNTTDNVTEYCVELGVASAVNTDKALTPASRVTARVDSIYFLRADVAADFTPGLARESTDDFIRRSRAAPTTRELITDRAFQTVLPDRHDEILRLYVAGHGDPEQMRDVIPFYGVGVHVGNQADIWVAAPLVRRSAILCVGPDGLADLAPLVGHVAHMLEARDEAGAYLPFTLDVDEVLWGSAGYRPASLRVGLPEGASLALTWLTSPTLPDIQATVDAPRVACFHPLVKSMHPVLLRFSLSIRLGNPKTDSAPEQALKDIRGAVTAHVEGLAKSGEPWVESEMVAAIHTAVPNVAEVRLPVSGTASLFDSRSGREVTVPLDSRLTPESFGPGLSRQISARTIQTYTEADFITVTPLNGIRA